MIKAKVKYLINNYGTNDPFEIASRKNIQVLFEDLGSVFGYHNRYKRISFIHINHNLGDYKQKFVCAHELGHAIFHPEVNTPFLRKNTFFATSKIEIEANLFAVELLLPDQTIYEYKDSSLTIKEIANMYGVPKELAHLKKYEFS